MFKIFIKNLKLYGYHGVKPEEKEEGQYFVFNVDILINKDSFNGHDDLSETLNYSEVIKLIKKINSSNKFDLIETLAEKIAYEIFKLSSLVKKVKIQIEKINPPIEEKLDSVGVSYILTSNKFNEKIINSKSHTSVLQNNKNKEEDKNKDLAKNKDEIENKDESIYFNDYDFFTKLFNFNKEKAKSPNNINSLDNLNNINDIINNINDNKEFSKIDDSKSKNDYKIMYLSIGTNKGNKLENIKKALNMIKNIEIFEIIKISSIYETEPMYYKEQDNFYNLVLQIAIKTWINPFVILGYLKNIEFEMGRENQNIKNGPRLIDIDILYIDDLEIDSDILKIPHPKLYERNFVLIPLSEINPDFKINDMNIKEYINYKNFSEKVIKLNKLS